jgi:hypothetical protein
MHYSPHTHLAIARERQADLIREARKHELARSVAAERPSLISRLRARFAERGAAQQPVARPA